MNSETVSLTNYFRIFAKNLNITKCYIMDTVLINSQFVHILEPCGTNTTQKIYYILRRSALHIMPHKSPKISQYLRFPSPSWSGSALENIKILIYSQHIANTPPTLHRIGQSIEHLVKNIAHHAKMLYFQSIDQHYLYLVILSIHDVISHMIHYNNIISYIQ